MVIRKAPVGQERIAEIRKVVEKNPAKKIEVPSLREMVSDLEQRAAKDSVTIRLDRRVLEKAKAGGPGWQTRLNDFLVRHYLKEGQE